MKDEISQNQSESHAINKEDTINRYNAQLEPVELLSLKAGAGERTERHAPETAPFQQFR
jgi:hypothetical protein